MNTLHHIGTKYIETERLNLRRFEVRDAEDMYRNWASDPEVAKYVTWPVHESVENTRQLLRLWENDYTETVYRWAIVPKTLNEVIGSIDVVRMNEKVQEVEIGYAMSREWWNQGIMTEALKAVIDYMIHRVGMNRVTARHIVANVGSGRVMEKAGMRYEGTLRSAAVSKQGLADLAVYAVLKCDFEPENRS